MTDPADQTCWSYPDDKDKDSKSYKLGGWYDKVYSVLHHQDDMQGPEEVPSASGTKTLL
jgi:hypothetical protein